MKRRPSCLSVFILVCLVLYVINAFLHGPYKTQYFRYEYTCKLCQSTRFVDRFYSDRYIFRYIPMHTEKGISYKSPGFSSCNHNWNRGVKYSLARVKDGIVVLLREKSKYGAFILRNQNTERAEYDWWYRSDGSGSFDTNLPVVTTGHGVTPGIRFGNFNVGWAAFCQRYGYLYYKHLPGDQVSSNNLHLCITNLNSVSGINAAAPEWKYLATADDRRLTWRDAAPK